MNKRVIVQKIIELSIRNPNLYTIQANQLLNSALLIVDTDPVIASVLYERAERMMRKNESF